ncbi:hypothetical protein F4677DRAFT_327890 [Hypoxylon crocopeplum]|nr:hypothetical protein F4677DRAFT_327890 [Hypoxylon crocopeplum]
MSGLEVGALIVGILAAIPAFIPLCEKSVYYDYLRAYGPLFWLGDARCSYELVALVKIHEDLIKDIMAFPRRNMSKHLFPSRIINNHERIMLSLSELAQRLAISTPILNMPYPSRRKRRVTGHLIRQKPVSSRKRRYAKFPNLLMWLLGRRGKRGKYI